MNDKISIILPVYNVEKYIKRCLNSIINQTYSNWELIIVNDGSTDNSERILLPLIRTDKRIKYYKQCNLGLSEARNTGLKHVTGNYICFIDSDDWIDKNYLMYLYKSIIETKSDLSICSYYIATDDEHRPHIFKYDNLLLGNEEFIEEVMNNRIECFAWNKLYKSEILKGEFFKKDIYFEDMIMLHKIIPKLNKISIVDRPLYYYYMRDDSIVHSKNIKKDQDRFNAYFDRFDLDYIKWEHKLVAIKDMMCTYYNIVQNSINKEDYMNYKIILKKNKNLLHKSIYHLSFIQKSRFLISFYIPRIYMIIFKTYNLARSNKS